MFSAEATISGGLMEGQRQQCSDVCQVDLSWAQYRDVLPPQQGVITVAKSLMAQWVRRVPCGNTKCTVRDLEVMGLNPAWVKLCLLESDLNQHNLSDFVSSTHLPLPLFHLHPFHLVIIGTFLPVMLTPSNIHTRVWKANEI